MVNCSVAGDIRVNNSQSGHTYVGGLAGNGLTMAQNLHFDGDIYVVGDYWPDVGGIEGASRADVVMCSSMGTISAHSNGGRLAIGGIVGEGDSGNIVSCINLAQVNGSSGGSGEQANTGGIVGDISRTLVGACRNFGAVTASGKGARVGGIVGYGSGGVLSCENSGTLSVAETNFFGAQNIRANRVGGIAGELHDTVSLMRDCVNYADVLISDTNPNDITGYIGTSTVGGVVGTLGNGAMMYCYNLGDVQMTLLPGISAYNDCGGVVGLTGGSPAAKIYQCYSLGNVTATGGRDVTAGGIVGDMNGYDSVVKSYSHGDVKAQSQGTAYAGGVAGRASSGTASVLPGRYIGGNYYYGTVQAAGSAGNSYSGSIVGEAQGAIIENNYFLYSAGRAVGRSTSILQFLNTGLTAAQMKQESAFDKFDFEQDWEIAAGQNGDMPRIRCMQLPDSQRPDMPAFYGRAPYFRVSFNANGGTVSPTSIIVCNGKPYGSDLSQLPTPTRSSYIFDGWFTASTGGTKVVATDIVDLTGNITLYARWTYVHSYTLNVVSGTGGGSYAAGAVVNISAYNAPKGKVFDQWTTTSTGTFADAGSVSTTFTMPASVVGTVTVTANYKDAPTILTTKYQSTVWNWIMFIMLFGWIWMWF